MAKAYRFVVGDPGHAFVGISIVADNPADAVAKANKWLKERAEITECDMGCVLDENELTAKTVVAFNLALYMTRELTENDIDDEDDAVDLYTRTKPFHGETTV